MDTLPGIGLRTALAAQAALGDANAVGKLTKIVKGQVAEPPRAHRIKDEYQFEKYEPLPLAKRRKLLEKRRKANR